MPHFDQFKIWVFISCIILPFVDSFPRIYRIGDHLSVKVSSLTSIDTQISYEYYSLPFCKSLEGVKDSAENLGELLMGDRIKNSPYRFSMYKNETEIFLCKSKSLTKDDYKVLTKRIDEMYQVNLNLDNLPAIRNTKRDTSFLRTTGYPIGIKVQDTYYMFNHLKFTVLVHKYEQDNVFGTGDGVELITTSDKSFVEPGYMVVGFKVVPCSIQHDQQVLKNTTMYGKYSAPIKCDPMSVAMAVKEGESVSFSYEVSFVESEINWPLRWAVYLKMEGTKVHWFSILYSLMVITFLAGIVLVILSRTIRQDLACYVELDREAQAEMNEDLSGRWKLFTGDVYRSPNIPKLVCVVVADGFRILGKAIATIFFAAMRFISTASRGALVTGILLLYMSIGTVAGFVTIWLLNTVYSGYITGWLHVSWRVACLFPGSAIFLVLLTLNLLLLESGSTGVVPFSVFLVLLLFWFCILVPLTLLAGISS